MGKESGDEPGGSRHAAVLARPRDFSPARTVALCDHVRVPRHPARGDRRVGRSQLVEKQNPSIQHWRLDGFWSFWEHHIFGIDRTRYRLDANLLVSQFRVYLNWKSTARQNASNQLTAGLVGSEDAWQHVVNDWQSLQTKWYSEEQASLAEYDASLQAYNAAKLITDTDALLSGQK